MLQMMFVLQQMQHRKCLTSIVFIQDSADPYIRKSVKRCFWPPYSQDLTLSDFWFRTLKNGVRGDIKTLDDLKNFNMFHVQKLSPISYKLLDTLSTGLKICRGMEVATFSTFLCITLYTINKIFDTINKIIH